MTGPTGFIPAGPGPSPWLDQLAAADECTRTEAALAFLAVGTIDHETWARLDSAGRRALLAAARSRERPAPLSSAALEDALALARRVLPAEARAALDTAEGRAIAAAIFQSHPIAGVNAALIESGAGMGDETALRLVEHARTRVRTATGSEP